MGRVLLVALLGMFASACTSTPSSTNSLCASHLRDLDQSLHAASNDIDAAKPTDAATSVALTAGLNAALVEVSTAGMVCSNRTQETKVQCRVRFENLASLLGTGSSELTTAEVSNDAAKSSATTKLGLALSQLQAAKQACAGSAP